jgi:hypothetical protein
MESMHCDGLARLPSAVASWSGSLHGGDELGGLPRSNGDRKRALPYSIVAAPCGSGFEGSAASEACYRETGRSMVKYYRM